MLQISRTPRRGTTDNIADIDIARGAFFVDLDVHLYEDNNKYDLNSNVSSEVLSETECQSSILGMVTPVNITSAEQFNQFVQIVGADRYVTITPWTEGSDTFVNFKGNIFFKPELRQWPFDRQELVIELVPTVPVSSCLRQAPPPRQCSSAAESEIDIRCS